MSEPVTLFYAVTCSHPAPPPTFVTMAEALACAERLETGPGACHHSHQILYVHPPKGYVLTAEATS